MGIAIINHLMFDGLYHPFMVMNGGWFIIAIHTLVGVTLPKLTEFRLVNHFTFVQIHGLFLDCTSKLRYLSSLGSAIDHRIAIGLHISLIKHMSTLEKPCCLIIIQVHTVQYV